MFIDDPHMNSGVPAVQNVAETPAHEATAWAGIQYSFAEGFTYASLERGGCYYEALGKNPDEARARLASMMIRRAAGTF